MPKLPALNPGVVAGLADPVGVSAAADVLWLSVDLPGIRRVNVHRVVSGKELNLVIPGVRAVGDRGRRAAVDVFTGHKACPYSGGPAQKGEDQ